MHVRCVGEVTASLAREAQLAPGSGAALQQCHSRAGLCGRTCREQACRAAADDHDPVHAAHDSVSARLPGTTRSDGLALRIAQVLDELRRVDTTEPSERTIT